jgi:hypothetical protein
MNSCIFCHLNPDESQNMLVCSNCCAILATLDNEKLNQAYQKAKELGYEKKADWLGKNLEIREIDDGRSSKASHNGSHVVRERPLRPAKPTSQRKGTKPGAFQLD